ncbi:sigma-70 family RNA polymerase sigma factor [Novosphingobium sp. KCTC 2891]|uniref:sigma-70 family RNA polymerase sigma factor n=1 Tax=Novosphingobium sp. KCTC 2891 TaxID=2989730 RepID=UPI002221C911|nr:sigma-70 family RNA polymerase sigma factor [Novosphingobium sp. KCTC 2891]MCW1383798.1 sigma-70 family RNA polymerase sigma factor [Novosphingobium sp. KCTC 2891]
MSDTQREIVLLLPRLRRMAWALARDGADGDDLLQRTVERTLERAGERKAGIRLDLWMFRVMKNLWIDEMRTRNRWKRLVEPLPDHDVIGDEGVLADGIADVVELARIRTLVEELPEEQRLAVKLVLLGGHSYTEAADILEVPEGTLTSRLARGRAALLQRYQVGRTRH